MRYSMSLESIDLVPLEPSDVAMFKSSDVVAPEAAGHARPQLTREKPGSWITDTVWRPGRNDRSANILAVRCIELCSGILCRSQLWSSRVDREQLLLTLSDCFPRIVNAPPTSLGEPASLAASMEVETTFKGCELLLRSHQSSTTPSYLVCKYDAP